MSRCCRFFKCMHIRDPALAHDLHKMSPPYCTVLCFANAKAKVKCAHQWGHRDAVDMHWIKTCIKMTRQTDPERPDIKSTATLHPAQQCSFACIQKKSSQCLSRLVEEWYIPLTILLWSGGPDHPTYLPLLYWSVRPLGICHFFCTFEVIRQYENVINIKLKM